MSRHTPHQVAKRAPLKAKKEAGAAMRRIRASGSAIFTEPAWTEIAGSLRLTRRELEIVRGVFDDSTELAIALDLGISPHTVHTHIERLRRKLAVVDRATLILLVVQEFLRLTAV